MNEIDYNQVNFPMDIGDSIDKQWDDSKYIAMLKCFGIMFNKAIYIYDCQKREILHFEGDQLFFNYDPLKDSKMYAFYEKRIHEEDLPHLLITIKKAFDFIHVLPNDRKRHACITSHFRMKGDSFYKLINHKFAPLEFTADGMLRIVLCAIVPSVETSPGNVYIRMHDTSQIYKVCVCYENKIQSSDNKITMYQ